MTSVLDPVVAATHELAPPAEPRPSVVRTAGGLATLSFAAAAIHAGLTPSHMDEWTAEGIGFLVATVVQVGLGALLLRRVTASLLQATVLVHLVVIGAWIVSRTSGFPLGPNSGHAESVGFVDSTAVAIEVVLVLGALARLARVRLPHGRLLAIGVPLLAVIAASSALASPSARNHAHGAHGEEAHHGDGPVIGNGFEELHNGHHAEIVQYPLDPASQRLLDEQIAITREVAKRYPTVAAAEAAGYKRAGPYAPGLGAHYVLMNGSGLNIDGRMDREDLEQPLSLQFAGTEPTAELAGFMYVSLSETEPDGFVGRNDVWHYHERLCLKFTAAGVEAPFGADNEATKAQCDSVGGRIVEQTQWMLHVWSVPGWSNAAGGIFGENNPKLSCPDGTYYRLPPEEWATHLRNVCRSEA